MTSVPQLKALKHYAAQLAMARYTPITSDLLGIRRTQKCGCTYRRISGNRRHLRSLGAPTRMPRARVVTPLSPTERIALTVGAISLTLFAALFLLEWIGAV